MIARAAQNNCSVFRRQGKLPVDEVICAFLRYAVRYENFLSNVKYTIQQMLGPVQDDERGRKMLSSQSVKEIWYGFDFLFGLLGYM